MELHGFLPIDKPLGWTSHDVVARLRRVVGTRRVGHAGTLDPAATGVLVTGVGRATKFLDLVQQGSKEYIAHVVLGVTTNTADIDGRLVPGLTSESPPSQDDIAQTLPEFLGEIDQIPPKYSAVKQGGEPLYKRMRRGEQIDTPTRRVRIDELRVVAYQYPDLLLAIRCGSGVYVRSIAEDIGAAIDCGAYLHHLLRTRVGGFSLGHCWSLQNLEPLSFPECWSIAATATDAAIGSIPAFMLDRSQMASWYHGRSIHAVNGQRSDTDAIRVYTADGTFAGIGSTESSGSNATRVQPRTVLVAR